MMVKVIVCITTYNLEKYISKAIDSVLCQVTNFDFKIIVADDCSTDGTLKILLDYKKTFPEKIEILTADKNQGSLANSNRLFDVIKCEYHSWMEMITGRRRQDYRSKLIFWISILIIQCVQVILSIL